MTNEKFCYLVIGRLLIMRLESWWLKQNKLYKTSVLGSGRGYEFQHWDTFCSSRTRNLVHYDYVEQFVSALE